MIFHSIPSSPEQREGRIEGCCIEGSNLGYKYKNLVGQISTRFFRGGNDNSKGRYYQPLYTRLVKPVCFT
jgi:hypothetical protein